MDPNYVSSKPIECDHLSWLGMPMLYDFGLCVNRTLEEVEESNKHKPGF